MKETILIATMWIVTICTYISYVPQIYKLIKTKKSDDLSIPSWVLWTLSAICNTVYSIVLLRAELIIASVSELLLIVATLILSLAFRNNKRTVSLLGVELDYNEDYEYIALQGIVANWYANQEAIRIIANECTSEGVLITIKNNKDIPVEIREMAAQRISYLNYKHLEKLPYVSGDWTKDNKGIY